MIPVEYRSTETTGDLVKAKHQYMALVHFADGGRDDPSPELLCDGPLKADRFRASSRQHPVQDRRSDGSLGLLGSEAVGS